MKKVIPQLDYSKEALAPILSEETINYHYGKHFNAYINNLNALIEGTPLENLSIEEIMLQEEGSIFNNAAQAWNHAFYFETLTPTPKEMPEKLKTALEENFNSVDSFLKLFSKTAASLFGSGWVWLSADKGGNLIITKENNAGNPLTSGLTPILTIDVWEHAYYIDYRNNRAAYIEAYLKLIDWEKVADRL